MVQRTVVMMVCLWALTTAQANAAVVELGSCGTLANVIANGCTVGDKLFANVSLDVQAGDGVRGRGRDRSHWHYR